MESECLGQCPLTCAEHVTEQEFRILVNDWDICFGEHALSDAHCLFSRTV